MSIDIQKIETRIVNHLLKQDRIVISHAGRHDTSRFLIVPHHGSSGIHGYGETAGPAINT